MEIRVLVPTDGKQEKVAEGLLRRNLRRVKRKGQLVAAVQQRQTVVALGDQLIDWAVARAPTGRRDRPFRLGTDFIVVGRKRLMPRQRFVLAEAAPMQV